jgi:hypothetical protein
VFGIELLLEFLEALLHLRIDQFLDGLALLF